MFLVRFNHIELVAMDLGDAAANAGDEAHLLQHAQQDVVAALQLLSGPAPVAPGNLHSNPQVPQIYSIPPFS